MKSILSRMISSTLAVAALFVVIGSFGVAADDNYNEHCFTWPPTGVPPEHRDQACDRVAQNTAWAANHFDAESAPTEDLIPDAVYLNLPEQKTWICPLDAIDETMGNNVFNNNISGIDEQKSDGYVGATGHPTRWILHNRSSNPIILTHINALGLEVSAMDFTSYPAHSNTAVYPRGPIVLPNTLAVVNGLQGQMFIVREYNEVLPMDAMMNEEEHKHSWKSFKSVLPPTLSFSFLPHQSRYETSKGVVHVLGKPGRVLMKHRMGNIFVKNQFGAVCPDGGTGRSLLGGDRIGDIGEDDNVNTDRKGTPKDMNPECNVLRKSFINKVGCPIDIYFAPENKVEGEDYNCEIFTKHLGSLSPFLSSDPTTRDIDGSTSPLKFENTYNGHSFVARMAHDQSLVARIDVDHDVVTDCPEPKRSGAGVEVQVDERLSQGMPVSNTMSVNASDFSVYTYYDMLVDTKVNATENPVVPRKTIEKKQIHDPFLHSNHTGILSASMSLIS